MNDTRLQLHWAAQAVSGVARTVLPKQADDSHSALVWSKDALRAGDGKSGLRLHDLTLLYGGDEFPLTGRTLDDAFRFFEERIGEPVARWGEAAPPEHPVAHGARFSPDVADLARFAESYATADRELRRIHTPVRCWPHHFDIATLIERGEGRTIGAGFVPGDAQYPEPYWYVTPYPYPEDRNAFAPLRAGFWNVEGWFGAVLPDSADARVPDFLDEAIEALSFLSC
jgi:hypothetical protein